MSNVFKHPKPFYGIFILEVWERFGYTSVISILAVFFVKSLGLAEENSFILFGAYSALIYSFVALGGFVGDQFLGAKRTIFVGLLTLLLGYFILGFGGESFVYFGLGLVCVGTGLFKSNPSSLLSKCYDKSKPELLHNAFTMFYMAINIGSAVGLFISPVISDKFGYKFSFITSGFGIIIAVLSFVYTRKLLKNIHTEAGKNKLSIFKLITVIIGTLVLSLLTSFLLKDILYAEVFLVFIFLLVVSFYFFFFFKEKSAIRMSMLLAFILMAEAVVFQILYGQMQTSINFFAINNVNPVLFGFEFNPQSFQSLNPLWIVLFSPVLAFVYMKLKDKGINYSIHSKFSSGMLLCSLAFLSLYFSKFYADSGVVSAWWVVLSYILQSTGELLISALGVAMVAELVPGKLSGFVMGMWFVFLSVGNLLSGYVATLVALPKDHPSQLVSLSIYTEVFLKIGIVAALVAFVMFMTGRHKSKLMPL